MNPRRARRAVFVLVVLGLLLGGARAVFAASKSGDFTVSASPATVSALQGTNAQYAITVAGTNGFKSSVGLTVSGLPLFVSASLTNNPNNLSAQSVLTVFTGPLSPTGAFALTITGTSGVIQHTASVMLTITKPGFTLEASPANLSVLAGSSGTVAVTITRSNLTAPIGFTVTGVPAHVTATFLPLSTGGNTTTLTVTPDSSAAAGSATLVIKGTSGTAVATAQVGLTITRPPPPSFTLAVSPDTINLSAGLSGNYTVTITRTNLTAPIGFAVAGLPAHATATFSPVSTSGNSTTMTVATGSDTPPGSYPLVVHGTSGATSADTTTHLSVSAAKGKAFTIAGTVDRALAPGVTGYLDLALTNTNNQTLSITNLSVSVTGTSKSGCSASGNFTTTQFSGTYPLSLPSNSARTLSQLGVPQSQWPKVTMLNLATNQDVCKSTSLTLGYAGTGIGN
jgi:hypothetical protein